MSRERAPSEKSAAHAESQRGRILDAAQRCFIADGFNAATWRRGWRCAPRASRI